MILISGATGTIGGEVLRQLADRGAPVRAMAREPGRVPVPDVPTVRADYGDPASLARAVAGVDTVFLLTAPTSPAAVAEHDAAMLAAAVTAGVRRVVKLSAVRVERFDELNFHLSGERAVRDSGLEWTILRPTSFASNTLSWAPLIRAGRPVPNPTGEGRQSAVDPRDVAAVAVRALTEDGHTGRTYTLTGPEPLNVPEQAERLGTVLGRTVRTEDLTAESYRDLLRSYGLAEDFVTVASRGAELARDGGNITVTDDVPRVLGRPATLYTTWARDHRDAFLAS